jgi:hypothetical protein
MNRYFILLLGVAGWMAVGCAPYRFGTSSLYPRDVRTVFVPIFESESFRRHMGERLTEAVIKEIESKTDYKVVGDASADSVLVGKIVQDRKRVLVENRNDDVRDVETSLYVQVTWTKRNGDVLVDQRIIPLDPASLAVLGNSAVVPESGQSIATGHQTAIRRIAQQIVGLMEAPW